MSNTFSVDDVIAAAKPVERIVPVCVAGELVGEYEQLKHELENLGPVRSLAGGRDTEIRKRLGELEREMQARTFDFRFRALSAKAWSDLVVAHPDKTGKVAFDFTTFPPAAIAACCVEPSGLDDPKKAEALLATLSAAQQGELFDAAWEVNNSAPKGTNSYSAFADLQDYVRSSASAVSEASPEASSSDE